jgi:hypothetical protein
MHNLLTDRITQGLQDIEKEPLLPEDTIQIYGPRGSTFDRHAILAGKCTSSIGRFNALA